MFSLVIPLYNEEKLMHDVYLRVRDALLSFTEDFEVILVDDGSTDGTLQTAIEIHALDNRFKVLQLSRNFGHQAAYTAGLSYAKGELIAMMDGDLQDPPELFKQMLEVMHEKQCDVVYALKKQRKERFFKRQAFKMFHAVFTKFSNLQMPANMGNFCLMNRLALNALLELKEKNRYLPGLRVFVGFKQEFIEYVRPDRQDDNAKMTYVKLFKLAMDALFSFSKVPIQICLILGVLGVLFTFFGAAIVLYKKLTGVAIVGWPSLLLSIYFIGSVQLLFLGIIGQYVHRIFVESQNRPLFLVKKFVED